MAGTNTVYQFKGYCHVIVTAHSIQVGSWIYWTLNHLIYK
jgi:hypothetical protein